ncbi:MAG: hypothetical protein RQ741_03585 [Wenzhouxiangellaceae bacterium]|nr:hypothetical protein [Wenzhouxiangellaceae bacterium]
MSNHKPDSTIDSGDFEPGPEAVGAPRFEFGRRSLDDQSGTITLGWRLYSAQRWHEFEERFEIPLEGPVPAGRRDAIEAALDLLHWIAGVSYWKAICRGSVAFLQRAPDAFQASVLDTVYQQGLAELAWQNGLGCRYWPVFTGPESGPGRGAVPAGLAPRVLVPMGGGKDSLVALERVRSAGFEPETVQVGSAALIADVAKRAGTRHRVIRRRLDPGLGRLNAAGALNGHVPITAINAAVMVVAALLWDFDSLVFANERSADAPTLTTADGRSVNHQFAKSFQFEHLLDQWIGRYIASDLKVFSILRRERELTVCREFAGLERYHGVFSSCNRNFHLDGPRTRRWCGQCPKCLFVFLALAPFLSPQRMQAIFGADLLDRSELIEGFDQLLELQGPRPFECVGEADEARAAVRMLAGDPGWRDHAVVAALTERLENVDIPEWSQLLAAHGDHLIPEKFLACNSNDSSKA